MPTPLLLIVLLLAVRMHLQTAMNRGRLLHLLGVLLLLRRMYASHHHVHRILGEFVAGRHLARFIVVRRIHTHFKIGGDTERPDLAKAIVMVMVMVVMVGSAAPVLLIARCQFEAASALDFAAGSAVGRLAAENVPLGGLLRDHLVQRPRVIIEVVEHEIHVFLGLCG